MLTTSSLTSPRLALYQLSLLGGRRIYVIHDVDLSRVIQHKTDIFSFDPFVLLAAKHLANLSKKGLKLVTQTSDSHGGVIAESHRRLHKILSSSAELENMGRAMFDSTVSIFDSLEESELENISLSEFIRHAITLASTTTAYGPMNPFADRRIEDSFW